MESMLTKIMLLHLETKSAQRSTEKTILNSEANMPIILIYIPVFSTTIW